MEIDECDFCEDDFDEETHPIWMTHNEVMFLDDSLTMMIERDSMSDGVTTMRGRNCFCSVTSPSYFTG